MINHEKLKKIEEAYLKYLPDYWSGENFKRKAIQHGTGCNIIGTIATMKC